ncbi:MAG: J domain-containing protein [Planctomycetia bacterium]|nr:J domain-containing protein [Planctomycetia bacterium]
MSPFEALGLAPTTDRAAIRRAYAQGVRLHRPDDDPAGFRAVRDAYETLSRLSDADLAALVAPSGAAAVPATAPADAAAGAPADPVTPEAARADGIVVPPTWVERVREARALAAGPARDAALVEALDVAAADAEADASRWLPWQWLVNASLDGRGDLLAELYTDARVVACLRHAPTGLTAVVPGALLRGRRWGRLHTLAAALVAAAPTFEDADACDTLRAAAMAVAVVEPSSARALADRAFALAAPAARPALTLELVDGLARVGDEAKDAAGETRLLLASIAAGAYDPATPIGGEDALRTWLASLGPSSVSVEMVAALAPPLVDGLFAPAARPQAAAPPAPRRSRWGSLLWLVLVVGAPLTHLITTIASPPVVPKLRVPREPSPDSRRVIDDLRRSAEHLRARGIRVEIVDPKRPGNDPTPPSKPPGSKEADPPSAPPPRDPGTPTPGGGR